MQKAQFEIICFFVLHIQSEVFVKIHLFILLRMFVLLTLFILFFLCMLRVFCKLNMFLYVPNPKIENYFTLLNSQLINTVIKDF